MRLFKEVLEYKEFLREYTLRQMQSRYRGSVMGVAWSLLLPLATLMTLAFVFAYINKSNMNFFGPFFMGGFVAWSFFGTALSGSLASVVGNANLVTRVRTPKAVFPLSAVILAVVEFAGLSVSLFVILALLGVRIPLTALFYPVAFVIMGVFIVGLSLLAAAACVFLRDLSFVWTAVNMLLFFCTPVLYPLTALPPSLRPFAEANPVYPFIRLFQDPLLGNLPPADLVATAVLYAVIMLAVGTSVFARSEKSFYQYL